MRWKMSEPIQIIVGANQPSEIWAGINKDEATVARFEMLMQAFGLSASQIEAIKGEPIID
jgi:hypothetical protein